jgi:hypothetical protein
VPGEDVSFSLFTRLCILIASAIASKWSSLFDDSEAAGIWRPVDSNQDEGEEDMDSDWVDDEDEAEEEGLAASLEQAEDNEDDDEQSSIGKLSDESEGEGEAPHVLQGSVGGSRPKINTADEARVYNSMKSKLRRGDLKKWGAELKKEALQATLLLKHKEASESQCVREADAAQKELENYVSYVAL